jgi:hypothetical protein
MVESDSDKKVKPNIQFKKLTPSELSSKIALLVSARSRVIFWKSTPTYYEGIAFSQKENDGIVLVISNVESLVKIKQDKVCLNVTIDEIEYFLSGNVVEHDDFNQMIFVKMSDECFRLENRERERVQVYPNYDFYCYIKYLINSPQNIILFNQKEDKKNKDFINLLNDERKKKIISNTPSISLEDEEDIIGFRIEDISSIGLSIIVSSAEKEKIIDRIDHKNVSLTISLGTNSIGILNAKIVYTIDYINMNFKDSGMYKIGISFNHSPTLKRTLEDVTGADLSNSDYYKLFEEYIRNE